MKRVIIIISLLGLFCSCEKELDQNPISDPTIETFYAIPNDFIQGANAIYAALRTYPDRQLNLSETRSDNLYAASDGGVRDWEGINGFHRTLMGNPYVAEAWLTNYNGINRANVLLQQLEINGEIVTDAELRQRLEGEARFLRALFYFDLVRWYGRVPIVDRVISASEAAEIPQSDVAEIYNFIIADLQAAAAFLPAKANYAGVDRGRATNAAAQTLLALVHMTRSGPDYGINGPGLGLNEWQQAADLLDEVINSGAYQLLEGNNAYASIFSYDNENNMEVIFDVQYEVNQNPVVGGTFAWLLAPDTWFNANGHPNQGGLTIRPVSNNLLDSYEEGDVRRTFSIQTGYTFNGVFEPRSFFKKYIDLSRVPNNRVDWPINFIVLRYTDVLLLRAECILNGASGSQQQVDDVVNQVRSRAGLGTVSGVNLAQLMEERRKEFAAEGSRWHDLIRTGLVEPVMTSWIEREDELSRINPFQLNYTLYPIPQAELDAKPGIYTQNPGY
ncbi:RagB/SusD family nutrient uptake outer membrane protein [Olivibacter sp. SDN3]|uniref:RagB/SusD family nutrient uptake outer membrane protein n=1 Tax=Olivibacter sp. SDN3 TaxID=2764720 RepID=UPI0016516EA4|nr:RagB/SusD family nutrient uptake outer membrane protein [Olivibacter sp. SDN3]QNL50486.1 RagB/SusD family nutrient uptake outer membrane protein [Olivibacter sp. SDN3]